VWRPIKIRQVSAYASSCVDDWLVDAQLIQIRCNSVEVDGSAARGLPNDVNFLVRRNLSSAVRTII
jgi:hypothetical protein